MIYQRSARAFRQPISLLLLGAAVSAMIAGSANAQNAAGTASTTVEAVTVTGTQIRGQAPVGSEMQSIDRAAIDTVGAITTQDILNNVPQVVNIGINNSSRIGTGGASNISYGSSIDLRGLGPFATLTLINGHRAMPAGTVGLAVDPSVVPTIMLQRIDIVADGGSATYGSDAIAGVANLIMRRNYDGLEVSVRDGWARGYNEQQMSFLFGYQWSSGQVTIGGEHAQNTALSGTSRSYYVANQVPFGGADYRVTTCNPGTLTAGGNAYAIPAGGVTPATANLLVAGTRNFCDPNKYFDLIPGMARNGVAGTFNQEITRWLRFFADAYYSRRDFSRNVPILSGNLVIPNANPNFVQPPGLNVTSETVGFFFGGLGGLPNSLVTKGYSLNEQLTIGLDADLIKDWVWETTGAIGMDHDAVYAPSINGTGTALTTALNNTNPLGALNVFGGPNNPALIASLPTRLTISPGVNHFDMLSTKIDGSMFDLPAGAAKFAVGAELDHYSTLNGQVATLTTAPVPWNVGLNHLSRDVYAFYGEVFIPLVGEGDHLAFAKKIDFDAGLRYTNYTIVGSTTNQKFGVNWEVNDDVKLHGSYGTSFRAPLLTELVGPSNAVFVQNYATPTGVQQGLTLSGGNLNLKPETAVTWAIGGEWAPSFLEGLHMNLNYYHISYKNNISSYLANLNILLNPTKYAALITPCPSQACTDLINKFVLGTGPNPDKRILNGILPANPVAFVDGRQQNLATTLTSGVDFGLGYDFDTADAGKFSTGINGTYVAEFNQSVTPGAPVLGELNRITFPMRLRFRGTLNWSLDNWTAGVFVNYTNGYINDTVTPVQRIDNFTTVDAHIAYDLHGMFGIDLLHDATLSLDIRNLFDTDPPYVNQVESANGGGGWDPQEANPFGRIVSVAIQKKF